MPRFSTLLALALIGFLLYAGDNPEDAQRSINHFTDKVSQWISNK